MGKSAETFRNALAKATEQYGSATELARKSGFKLPQILRYRTGQNVPSLDALDRLADALGDTPANLIGGITPPPGFPSGFAERLGRLPALRQKRIWELMELALAQHEADVAAQSPGSSGGHQAGTAG